MKVLLAVCSEGTSVDVYTGKLSIFNVLGRLSSLGFPMWIPELSLTLAFEREYESLNYQGKIIAALGENRIHEGDFALNFADDGVARTVVTFSLAIPAPGVLTFSIEGESKALEVFRLPVVQINVERDEAVPQLPDSQRSDPDHEKNT